MNSRFEFLGNTTIGQYIPRDSLIHRLDPRARLLIYLALFTGIVFTPRFSGLLLGLGIVLFLYILAKIPAKPGWQSFRRALPFLLILAVLQIILGTIIDTDVILGNVLGVIVTQRAAFNAGMLLARFFIIVFLLNGYAMTLSTSQVTSALFYLLKPLEKLRFPINDLTAVVKITMRFLPMIAQSAEKIAKAQAARGGDWEQKGFNPIRQAKRVLPLIAPLMVNSLKRAETMALAMESRGFNAAITRSSFYTLKFTLLDVVFLLMALLISLLMLLL